MKLDTVAPLTAMFIYVKSTMVMGDSTTVLPGVILPYEHHESCSEAIAILSVKLDTVAPLTAMFIYVNSTMAMGDVSTVLPGVI